jgi:hypothetical protein
VTDTLSNRVTRTMDRLGKTLADHNQQWATTWPHDLEYAARCVHAIGAVVRDQATLTLALRALSHKPSALAEAAIVRLLGEIEARSYSITGEA